MVPTIRVAASVGEQAWEAAGRVARAAEDAVVATGRFVISLSGGGTPQPLFKLLATEFAQKLPWDKVQVLFTDERCVPPDHHDSNFGMACRLLLDHVPLPYENIHRMAGEKDPHVAAAEYDQRLQQQFGAGPDLVILGVGEEGHTASLFPHTTALAEKSRACVANHVPKLDAWRLTMTASYINRAFEVLVLANGKGKAPAVRAALEGLASPTECPIRLIEPASGRLVWLLDAEAAGMDMDDEPADSGEDNEGESAG